MAPVREESNALVIVDVQNDFCPAGSLAVPLGDRVVPPLNRLIESFERRGLPIYFTRDWHPDVTTHFKAYGGTWPPHCVAGTKGAGFHPDLRIPESASVVSKGTRADEDAYSGFQGRTAGGVPFAEELRRRGITRILVGGLATDYCVKSTVLDALSAGFGVTVVEDGIAAVNLGEKDGEQAILEMKRKGAEFERSSRLA